MRYHPSEKLPNPVLVYVMLVLMALALSLMPKLVFAAGEDPLARYTLTPKQVAEVVAQEIQKTGIADLVEASIELKDPNTVFGSDTPVHVEIRALEADSKNKRWAANVMFKHGDTVMTALPMQGTFQAMVKLPALIKPYASGQVIQREDIDVVLFPAQHARNDVIIDIEQLAGKASKRNISADRPIRQHEIIEPRVVKKNDLVQIEYRTNNLTITTSGVATTDASVGEVIAVKNVNSSKIIHAQVKNAKTVSVEPFVQTSALGNSHAEYN